MYIGIFECQEPFVTVFGTKRRFVIDIYQIQTIIKIDKVTIILDISGIQFKVEYISVVIMYRVKKLKDIVSYTFLYKSF